MEEMMNGTDIKKMSDQEINYHIERMVDNPIGCMLTYISIVGSEIYDKKKEIDDRLVWYSNIMEDLVKKTGNLSVDEKREFLSIHTDLLSEIKI